MKLSRIDLIPLLTIMAGGVLGASLSFGFLGLLSSGDVPSPDAVVVLSVTPELAVRLESSDGAVVTSASIEFDGMVITPVFAPSASDSPTLEAAVLVGGSVRLNSDDPASRLEKATLLLERDRMERVQEIREVFIIDSNVRIR